MGSPHYIGGNGPVYGAFSKQVITGNSSATSFALTYAVPSAMALLVVKDGAVLNPLVDYSISASGTTIIFAVAPTGVNVVWLVYLGVTVTQATSLVQNVTVDAFTGDGTTAAFTLSSTPFTIDNLLVFVDGVLQAKTANYTLSDSTLTFTSAPDTSAVIIVHQVLTKVEAQWQSIDSSITAVNVQSNGKYLVDANSAGTTATLPGAPSVGDTMDIVNVSSTPHTVTVERNGLKIDGGTSNVSLTTYGSKVSLVYSGPTKGWITIDS